MTGRAEPGPARIVLGWLSVAGLLVVLMVVGRGGIGLPAPWHPGPLAHALRADAPAVAVAGLVRWLALSLAAYLLVMTTLAAAGLLVRRGGPVHRIHLPAPPGVRHLVAGVLGLSTATAVATLSVIPASYAATPTGGMPPVAPTLHMVAPPPPGPPASIGPPTTSSPPPVLHRLGGPTPPSVGAPTFVPPPPTPAPTTARPDGPSLPAPARGPAAQPVHRATNGSATNASATNASATNGRATTGPAPSPATTPSPAPAVTVTPSGVPGVPAAAAPPVPATPGQPVAAGPRQAASPTTWTVRPGDHLWSISAAVLAGAWGHPATEPALARYWWTVVQGNRAQLHDPDLLFPGDIITLPPVPADPGA